MCLWCSKHRFATKAFPWVGGSATLWKEGCSVVPKWEGCCRPPASPRIRSVHTCGQPWLTEREMLKADAGGSGKVTVVGVMSGQAMGRFSMRYLRGDGKGDSLHVEGGASSWQAKQWHQGCLGCPKPSLAPPMSPAARCGHHSLVLLNIGHNSGHCDKGLMAGGQGG